MPSVASTIDIASVLAIALLTTFKGISRRYSRTTQGRNTTPQQAPTLSQYKTMAPQLGLD